MALAPREEVLARVRAGLIYSESEAAFQAPLRRADLIFEYNRTPPSQTARQRELMALIFGSVGARAVLNPPFSAAFGSNVHIGDDFYGNANLTFVDDVEIKIGDGVMVAPNVTLATTGTRCTRRGARRSARAPALAQARLRWLVRPAERPLGRRWRGWRRTTRRKPSSPGSRRSGQPPRRWWRRRW